MSDFRRMKTAQTLTVMIYFAFEDNETFWIGSLLASIEVFVSIFVNVVLRSWFFGEPLRFVGFFSLLAKDGHDYEKDRSGSDTEHLNGNSNAPIRNMLSNRKKNQPADDESHDINRN